MICFVQSKAKAGTYSLNPFNFQRSWNVTVDSLNETIERPINERERYLEQRLAHIEAQFQALQENLAKSAKSNAKGKGGKGKKSKPNLESEIEEEAQRRLRVFLAGQHNETSSTEQFHLTSSEGFRPSTSGMQPQQMTSRESDDAWTNDSSSVRLGPPISKKIFISRVDLTINGTSVDQIPDQQTEDECMQA